MYSHSELKLKIKNKNKTLIKLNLQISQKLDLSKFSMLVLIDRWIFCSQFVYECKANTVIFSHLNNLEFK